MLKKQQRTDAGLLLKGLLWVCCVVVMMAFPLHSAPIPLDTQLESRLHATLGRLLGDSDFYTVHVDVHLSTSQHFSKSVRLTPRQAPYTEPFTRDVVPFYLPGLNVTQKEAFHTQKNYPGYPAVQEGGILATPIKGKDGTIYFDQTIVEKQPISPDISRITIGVLVDPFALKALDLTIGDIREALNTVVPLDLTRGDSLNISTSQLSDNMLHMSLLKQNVSRWTQQHPIALLLIRALSLLIIVLSTLALFLLLLSRFNKRQESAQLAEYTARLDAESAQLEADRQRFTVYQTALLDALQQDSAQMAQTLSHYMLASASSEDLTADLESVKQVGILLTFFEYHHPQSAALLLKDLDMAVRPHVIKAMESLRHVNQKDLQEVVFLSYDILIDKTELYGGRLLTQEVKKALYSHIEKPSEVVEKDQFLASFSLPQLYLFLAKQPPETASFIMSMMDKDRTAELLSMVDPEAAKQLIEKMLTLKKPSDAIIESYQQTVQHEIAQLAAAKEEEAAPIMAVSELIEQLDPALANTILETLSPEMKKSLNQYVVKFENIEALSVADLGIFIEHLSDVRTLAILIFTGSNEFKQACIPQLSERAKDIIRQEIELFKEGGLSEQEINEAKRKAVHLARELDQRGVLTLGALHDGP